LLSREPGGRLFKATSQTLNGGNF